MRAAITGALALTLACYALPAAAQQPETKPSPAAARKDASKMGPRTVTGSVKTATEKGLVVVGHEQGQKDKEWAFALDAGTRVRNGQSINAFDDAQNQVVIGDRNFQVDFPATVITNLET